MGVNVFNIVQMYKGFSFLCTLLYLNQKSFLPLCKLRIVHPFWVKALERIPIGEHLARTIDQKSSGKTQSRTDT